MTPSCSASEGRAAFAAAALALICGAAGLFAPWAAVAGAGLGAMALAVLGVRALRRGSESGAARPDADADAQRAALQAAVAEVTALLDGACRGDLETRLQPTPKTEPGHRLAVAANDLLDVVDAFTREARGSIDTLARSLYHRRFLTRGLDGSFARTAQTITDATVKMGERDSRLRKLTDTLESDVLGVAKDLDGAAAQLQHNSRNMIQVVELAERSAGRITQRAEDSAVAAADVSEAAKAIETALGVITERTRVTSELASRSAGEVGSTQESVRALLDGARRIGGVVDIIRAIASQSSLLAVNAMIEAARSGEAGAGFAVVAREIQDLAERSRHAADQIASEIGAAQIAAKTTAGAVESVGSAIGEMSREAAGAASEAAGHAETVVQIAARIGAVADSAQAVGALAADVARAVEDVSRRSGKVGAEADSVLSRAERLGERIGGYLEIARGA